MDRIPNVMFLVAVDNCGLTIQSQIMFIFYYLHIHLNHPQHNIQYQVMRKLIDAIPIVFFLSLLTLLVRYFAKHIIEINHVTITCMHVLCGVINNLWCQTRVDRLFCQNMYMRCVWSSAWRWHSRKRLRKGASKEKWKVVL